jgi:hypothetical protein
MTETVRATNWRDGAVLLGLYGGAYDWLVEVPPLDEPWGDGSGVTVAWYRSWDIRLLPTTRDGRHSSPQSPHPSARLRGRLNEVR